MNKFQNNLYSRCSLCDMLIDVESYNVHKKNCKLKKLFKLVSSFHFLYQFFFHDFKVLLKKGSPASTTFYCKKIDKIYLNFRCCECDEEFNLECNCNIHGMLVHTHPEAIDGRNFKCMLCSKIFVRISAFDAHLRTHLISDLLKCSFCKQEFEYQVSVF